MTAILTSFFSINYQDYNYVLNKIISEGSAVNLLRKPVRYIIKFTACTSFIVYDTLRQQKLKKSSLTLMREHEVEA